MTDGQHRRPRASNRGPVTGVSWDSQAHLLNVNSNRVLEQEHKEEVDEADVDEEGQIEPVPLVRLGRWFTGTGGLAVRQAAKSIHSTTAGTCSVSHGRQQPRATYHAGVCKLDETARVLEASDLIAGDGLVVPCAALIVAPLKGLNLAAADQAKAARPCGDGTFAGCLRRRVGRDQAASWVRGRRFPIEVFAALWATAWLT